MWKKSYGYAILQDYALTLKSQRVAKFIAVASSALGTVFLGKEPYGLPIKAWKQKKWEWFIFQSKIAAKSKMGSGLSFIWKTGYAPKLLNEKDLLLQFLSLLLHITDWNCT